MFMISKIPFLLLLELTLLVIVNILTHKENSMLHYIKPPLHISGKCTVNNTNSLQEAPM